MLLKKKNLALLSMLTEAPFVDFAISFALVLFLLLFFFLQKCVFKISKMLKKCRKREFAVECMVLSSGLQMFNFNNSECLMVMTRPLYHNLIYALFTKYKDTVVADFSTAIYTVFNALVNMRQADYLHINYFYRDLGFVFFLNRPSTGYFIDFFFGGTLSTKDTSN